MARKPKIAIIGGGLGGLAACLALDRRGIEAAVYERAPDLGEIGAGLTLSPNALKVLRAHGVEDDAIEIGFQPRDQVVRSWRSGRVIARQPRGGGALQRFGAAFITIHRADLLSVFANALPADRIRLGAQCTGVVPADDGAVARFADGTEIEADVVVGADGIHSAVRESLFGHIAPTFTGCICWRGMVPREAVADAAYAHELTAWWGPHGHIVHYPVRRGELVNFVAHIDSDGWTEESWTYECDRAEVLETYAAWNDSLRRLMAASPRYYKWALYDRDPLERWGEGRVTLLGDSAHPMLPYLGQGACMAIEDGCILAEAIARAPDRLTEALRDYERLRMPRTRRAQLGSRRRAKENHLPSPLARLRRNMATAWRSRFGRDKSPTQGEWLYEYDASAETGYAVTPRA